MNAKKTLVIGASTNTERYSYMATNRLLDAGHDVVLIGNRMGSIRENLIHTNAIEIDNLDTITLYLNPKNQEKYYDYIISLKPKRIIFNPGTENIVLEEIAHKNGIQTMEACTLVMLSTGQY
jgi:predicted CoA-binding protein